MTDRQKLLAAILASIPALLMACTAWVQADAAAKAKMSEANLYQQAGDQLGLQSDEMLHLQAKLDAILAKCDPGPRGLIISGNEFGPPGVANVLVTDKPLRERNR